MDLTLSFVDSIALRGENDMTAIMIALNRPHYSTLQLGDNVTQ